MQLNKLGAVTGLLLTAVLSACGGGGEDAPPPAAAPAPPAVLVSAANSTALRAIVNTQVEFDGGKCSGGTPPYAPTAWDYGDGTGTTNTHTYTVPGTYSVVVTCTDSKNVSKQSKFSIDVLSAAYAGFLGKTWSAYANIDAASGYLYPVAGIAQAGDIYGVWLRSNVDEFTTYMTTTDVAVGSTNFSATSWTLSTDVQKGTKSTPSDMAPFDGTGFNPTTAAIDMAVSPNGKAIAAWMTVTDAGTKLLYSTKNVSGDWSNPTAVGIPASGPGAVIDASIKVVVNDTGDGAIAYCTGTTPTARMVVYSKSDDSTGTPIDISEKCERTVSYLNVQRTRAFDIAIDDLSKIIAVGITTSGSNSLVTAKTYTYAGPSVPPAAIASPYDAAITSIPTAELPGDFSLSFALSPDSKVAGVAWTEKGSPPSPYASSPKLTNVLARIYAANTWGSVLPTQALTIHNFSRPLIAVNDAGVAFLAAERPTTPTSALYYRTYVSNYAHATGWRTSVTTDSDPALNADYRFNATDIAIDEWGTGLVTRSSSGSYTQAGTLSLEGTWSGFKTIPSSYTGFHYQTMRALPDGRAIVVTSVKIAGGNSRSGYLRSGYMLLK